MSATQPRQNFHEESEAGINKQINMELYASYVYQSMAFYFDRDDVALGGFFKLFKDFSDCSHGNAEKLMKYQNKRGGRVLLQDVKRADRDEWGSGLEAMETSLSIEKNCNQAMIDLHKIAEGKGDAAFADFLECDFLNPITEKIKTISDHVTNLKRVGPGLGEYLFNKETLEG